MPPRDMFDPDGMHHDKRQEYESWYLEQIRCLVNFNLPQEMKEYCFPDAKLLKTICQKFQEDFMQKAQFDPLEQCITMGSTCNL